MQTVAHFEIKTLDFLQACFIYIISTSLFNVHSPELSLSIYYLMTAISDHHLHYISVETKKSFKFFNVKYKSTIKQRVKRRQKDFLEKQQQ